MPSVFILQVKKHVNNSSKNQPLFVNISLLRSTKYFNLLVTPMSRDMQYSKINYKIWS